MPISSAYARNTRPFDDDHATVVTARAMLRRLDAVRLKVTSGPGLGPFAAGRSVLDGLLRLGFAGLVQVCFPAVDRDQMAICFPGFPDGATVRGPADNEVEVAYVPVVVDMQLNDLEIGRADVAFHAQQQAMLLGIFSEADEYGLAGDGTLRGGLSHTSPAEHINTRCAALLQPFAWYSVRRVQDLETGFDQEILQDGRAGYLTEIPNWITRVPTYQRDGPRLAERYRGYIDREGPALNTNAKATLTAAMARAAQGTAYLWPVYGLHTNSEGKKTLNCLVRAAVRLFGANQLDRPVIIFNIRGANAADQESLTHSTEVLATSAGGAGVVRDAQDGEIVIVRSPGLPTELFQQVAGHATLPMLLEGANTANLCLQLGTPFIALSDNASIPDLDVNGARGHVVLRAITTFIWRAERASDTNIETLSDAIVDTKTPDRVMSRYYAGLHQQVRSPANDQLSVALATLANQANPDHPIRPLIVFKKRAIAVPPPTAPRIYKCPRCRNFASAGPGQCWRCGVSLVAE